MLKASNKQQGVADSNDNQQGNNAGGNTSGKEMLNAEITVAGLGVFHHDRSFLLHKRKLAMEFFASDIEAEIFLA